MRGIGGELPPQRRQSEPGQAVARQIAKDGGFVMPDEIWEEPYL
jgi:hypothetical protein